MKKWLALAFIFALGVIVYAQATHIQTSNTLPGDCRVGDIYLKTGSNAGFYYCAAASTWTGPVATGSGSGDVTAASNFANDNRIIRSDGTTKGVQASAITIDDSGNVSGVGTFALTGAMTFPDGIRQTFNPDGTNAGINVGAQAGDPSSPSNGDLWYDSSANELTARINSANVALGTSSNSVTKIEEQSPSGVSSVTFSSLGSYNSLRIVATGRSDASAINVQVRMTFNGDTGSNYDFERLSLAGTATPTAAESNAGTSVDVGTLAGDTADTGNIGAFEAIIPNYALTTFHKAGTSQATYKQGNAANNTVTRMFGWHWRSTAAITSITLTLSSGNFKSGSKVTLYGMP